MTLAYLQGRAFTISGPDALGRIKFTGTESDAPGGRPLGIEFSQSDLFFGVRKATTSRVARFVWNDNAAGTGTDLMVLSDTGQLHLQTSMLAFNAIVDITPTAKWVPMKAGYGAYILHDTAAGAFTIATSSNSAALNAGLTWVQRLSIRASDGFAQFGGPVAVSNDALCQIYSTGAAGQKVWAVTASAYQAYTTSNNTWTFGGSPSVNGINNLAAASVSVSGDVAISGMLYGTYLYAQRLIGYNSGNTLVLSSGPGAGLIYFRPGGAGGDSLTGQAWINTSGFLVTTTGFKPGGGTWVDSSDARIKTVRGDYAAGLEAIRALHPVRFTYKGNDTNHQGTDTAKEYVGMIAQEVETVMPEMVTLADSEIDGEPVSDMRILDTAPLIYAVCNAVRELAERLETVERRAA